MSEAVLLVGTKKGLWVGRSDESRRSWTWSDPEFLMQGVYATCIDTRGDAPRVFASGTSEHFGPSVYRVRRPRPTWNQPKSVDRKFPEGLGSSLERVWQIQPGRADEPDVLYAGSQPSALFRSTDRGESFELVRSSVGPPAPARLGRRVRGPGDPHDRAPSRRRPQLTVAMSTGGVYRTADGGK